MFVWRLSSELQQSMRDRMCELRPGGETTGGSSSRGTSDGGCGGSTLSSDTPTPTSAAATAATAAVPPPAPPVRPPLEASVEIHIRFITIEPLGTVHESFRFHTPLGQGGLGNGLTQIVDYSLATVICEAGNNPVYSPGGGAQRPQY